MFRYWVLATLFTLFFYPVLSVADSPESATNHTNQILVKLTDDTSLYNDLSSLFSKARVKSIDPGTGQLSPSVEQFLETESVRELKPLRERQSFKPTSHGLERIFLADIHDSASFEDVLNRLNQRDDVEYAESNYIGHGAGRKFEGHNQKFYENEEVDFPNDSHFSHQWGLNNIGQEIGEYNGIPGADINIMDVWEVTTGSPEVTMAVLDSGIPQDHPEFSGRLVDGYDFVNDNENPEDDHGHGTSVASIAAASGNNDGLMAGVDWETRIMPVKILDEENEGQYSWWIQGIEFAVDNGADVINMSVGGSGESQALQDAVNYALDNDIPVIATMMNENNDVTYYPAGYDDVIALSATNNRDERDPYYGWGRIDAYAAIGEVRAPTNVSDPYITDEKTDQFRLSQNYPNPFNPSTNIEYSLAEQTEVTLTIYTALGSEVRTIVDDFQQPGEYSVAFDASDLATGMYLYTLQTSDFTETRQMLYVK